MSDATRATPSPPNPGVRRGRRESLGRSASASVVAGLAFVVADRLGLVTVLGVRRLLDLDDAWLFWIAVIGAALLASTRARAVPWALSGAILLVFVIAAFTPLFVPAIRSWLIADAPSRADAIVVLSADVTDDGHISSNGTIRYLAALELARRGFAPLLVRTDISPPDADDTVDARTLAEGTLAGMDVELALVGPVASTRDEAVAMAELARERGLERVIVVTQPMHERRAAAAFRAVGLEVIACPSPERQYSLPQLATPEDRMFAFSSWITEIAAWALYDARGWVREEAS